MTKLCPHLKNFDKSKMVLLSAFPKFECEECIKINSKWLHLRICQTCGKMLCCDSSPNRHARKHCIDYGHSIISSGEFGEHWLYCFEDDVTINF